MILCLFCLDAAQSHHFLYQGMILGYLADLFIDQIEPAVSKKCDAFEYLDYKPLADGYYLIRTAYWVDEFRKARSASEDVQ